MNKPLVCLLSLCAAGVQAQEPVKLLPGPFELPARLGPLVYVGKPASFDDPRLGKGYNYDADGARLSIYVYDAGIADIPDGADSIPVCEQFEEAKQIVRQSPSYKNAALGAEQLARLSPPEDAPLAREAAFELDRGERHAVSYVWITGAAKHFVKLRFTMFAPHSGEIFEARRAILDALGNAIRPHLAPVVPEAKEAGASLNIAFDPTSSAGDMGASLGYLMFLNGIAEENTANMPVCGGPYVPTFEDEVAALQGALLIEGEAGGKSKFMKTLAKAAEAGFLEELIWTGLHRDSWGTQVPEGLTLTEYEPWRKKNAKKLQVPNLGSVSIDHPRPLPLEPNTPVAAQ